MPVLPVFLVGCLLFVMGSLSWVLRSHCAYNNQYFIQTIEHTSRQQHTRKSKINRKPRHISSDSRDILAVIHCLKLKQKLKLNKIEDCKHKLKELKHKFKNSQSQLITLWEELKINYLIHQKKLI